MAKSNFLAMMKAKPNARGKRSHLPLHCSVHKCDNDFIVSHSQEYPPKRYCATHSPIFNPKPVNEKKVLLDQLNAVLAL